MLRKLSPYIIGIYILLIPVSIYYIQQLRFEFEFEQFFPIGDPDLAFFQKFIEDFESDDNFLLVGVEPEQGIADSVFLNDFHKFTLDCRKLPYVKNSTSLTTIDMPIKTPFGYNSRPMIHLDKPDRYDEDLQKACRDPRLKSILIDEEATTLVVNLKAKDKLHLQESEELMSAVHDLLEKYSWEDAHILGRANFQSEMVKMQTREIIVSTVVSVLLVILILILIFRKKIGVAVAIGSISLSLLYFLALLAALGREMNLMAALYPVLMLIVGTSDVVHIMTKYIDELEKGHDRLKAMSITMRQIGVATLLTSITTAIGFASLMTSNITPIKQFGANAAIGVILAYVVVITLTTSVLILFDKEKLMRRSEKENMWDTLLAKWYDLTHTHSRQIVYISLVLVGLFIIGIMNISTNYRIERNLPLNEKITKDFEFFERKLNGFRPLEFAVTVKDKEASANGYTVLKEVAKIEDHLATYPNIKSIYSLATVYKSINSMNHSNDTAYYRFPEDKRSFAKAQRLVKRMPKEDIGVFVSKNNDKTRISSRVSDVGADVIKAEGEKIDGWIQKHIDTALLHVKRTGMGIIIDKNAEFIRRNLFEGLLLALGMVCLLMVLLFRDIKMLIIALIPNVMPLLFAGALLGYLGIELEASISIIFAIVFGIAVDDTIHFLSKYRLVRLSGAGVEEALRVTFMETGKAITFTTIILFFGFLVMLFSVHPPSFTVGLLISVTLVGAWVCDLFLLTVIMRKYLK